MEFLNKNQYMNTNMREKMLKKISNKHNLSEIASKTENRPDYVHLCARTYFKGSVSRMQLENACAS